MSARSLPRSRAISPGSLSMSSPAIVARTTLCGFADPSDLVMMLPIPADSTTALTAPPAMMPVPSGAGFSSTLPAPKFPMIACGMVVPCSGDADQTLLGGFDPLLDGRRHFFRLPDTEANHAMAIADDDERTEAQVLATLHHLGDAVNGNDVVLDVELARIDSLTCTHCVRTPDLLYGPRRPRRERARGRENRSGRRRRA